MSKSVSKWVGMMLVVGALAAHAEPPRDLTGPVVYVNVTVRGSSVRCDPEVVKVTKPNTLVVFQLVGTTHSFASAQAVQVLSPSPDFPLVSWSVNTNQAALVDQRLSRTMVPYRLNLINLKTGAALIHERGAIENLVE